VPRILVVDDEPTIVGFVRRALHAKDFATEGANTPDECLRLLAKGDIDLVVLDLMLPGITDLFLVEQIRSLYPAVKIIVLSAVMDVRDKVRCLDLGAADYVTKPFALAELLARVDARLSDTAEAKGASVRPTCAGRITLDPKRQCVGVRGKSVSLSQREYLLLTRLTSVDGPVTREELLSDVWGFNFDTGSNVVDVYVKRLRGKLGADVIETVRNVGYRVPAA
jgi:two-component system, OmpR family, response regulator